MVENQSFYLWIRINTWFFEVKQGKQEIGAGSNCQHQNTIKPRKLEPRTSCEKATARELIISITTLFSEPDFNIENET